MSEVATQSNSEAIMERTPTVIAAEINTIKAHVRQIAATSSVEIGRRLVEAKAKLGHGEWMPWLKESVEYSQSTANNLMNLYEQYGSDKIASVGNIPLENLSYTKALALLALPAEERDEFVEAHDIKDMSARDIQQAIKAKQEAERKAWEAEQRAKKAEEAKKAAQDKVFEINDEKLELAQKIRDQEVELERLESELLKAKETGDDTEVTKLQGDLSEYRNKIKDLEKALKEKPIEAGATVEVEVIPPDIEAELKELREKAAQQPAIPPEVEAELSDLRKKLELNNNEPVVKYKIRFEAFTAQFKELQAALDEIPEDKRDNLKKALKTLVGRMAEKL